MIRTLRASDVLTLPGTISGLLDGYCGPVEEERNSRTEYAVWVQATYNPLEMMPATMLRQTRLPFSRSETRYRAACFLAERGHPLWWALSPGPSTLPEWVGTACLWASVVRVAAGMGAVKRETCSDAIQRPAWIIGIGGGKWGVNGISGLPYDTEAAAAARRDEINSRWLASGYALLNGNSLTVEVPDV